MTSPITCVICCEESHEGDPSVARIAHTPSPTNATANRVDHFFHKECIQRQFEMNQPDSKWCVLCRQKISSVDGVPLVPSQEELCQELFHAIKIRRLDAVQALFKEHPSLLQNNLPGKGLIHAAECNQEAIVQEFLKYKNEISLDSFCEAGCGAMSNRNLVLAQKLIDQHCDPAFKIEIITRMSRQAILNNDYDSLWQLFRQNLTWAMLVLKKLTIEVPQELQGAFKDHLVDDPDQAASIIVASKIVQVLEIGSLSEDSLQTARAHFRDLMEIGSRQIREWVLILTGEDYLPDIIKALKNDPKLPADSLSIAVSYVVQKSRLDLAKALLSLDTSLDPSLILYPALTDAAQYGQKDLIEALLKLDIAAKDLLLGLGMAIAVSSERSAIDARILLKHLGGEKTISSLICYLMIAAKTKDLEAMQYILNDERDFANQILDNALFESLERGDTSAIEFLQQHNQDQIIPALGWASYKMIATSGILDLQNLPETPLKNLFPESYSWALKYMIKEKNFDAINSLLQKYSEEFLKPIFYQTLRYAIQTEEEDIINALLTQTTILAPYETVGKALVRAAGRGNLSIFKLIGAHQSRFDPSWLQAFKVAAANKDHKITHEILKFPQRVDRKTYEMALSGAVENNHFKVVKELLKHSRKISQRSGRTNFDLAVLKNRLEIMQEFITNYPHLSPRTYSRALMRATNNDSREAIEMLLSANASFPDLTLNSAIELAENRGYSVIAALLREQIRKQETNN